MSSFRKAASALVLIALAGSAVAQTGGSYPGIGRTATPKEVIAWDIDVRPDFKGLPPGSGSVAKGQDVWETKCSSCHGVFGESNEVFNPLIGGTSAEDVKTGRVAKLKDPAGGRTTFMKVATISTVWDYINRAMPWTAPKSLTPDEVYSVTAFLLNLAGVVPENFTLSNQNIAEVQQRMPNRNGMQTNHNLWPGSEFGGTKQSDTRNTACMKNCVTEVAVASFLPDFARDAHGNLAEQNRIVGAQKGADTSRPESKSGAPAAAAPAHQISYDVSKDPVLIEEKLIFKTKADIDSLPIAYRVKYDESGFWEYLWNDFKHRQEFLNLIFIVSIKNSFMIRVFRTMFLISLEFAFNSYFYQDNNVEKQTEYIEKNGTDSVGIGYIIVNELIQSFACVAASVIITFLLDLIIIIPSSTEELLNDKLISDNEDIKEEGINEFKKNMKWRYIIWIICTFIIHFVCWYFSICFCAVFVNSNKTWLYKGLLSLVIGFLLIKIFVSLFLTTFRTVVKCYPFM